jgi:hypothetical protein
VIKVGFFGFDEADEDVGDDLDLDDIFEVLIDTGENLSETVTVDLVEGGCCSIGDIEYTQPESS